MRSYFTKRHSEALKEQKLKPYLPIRLRVAIRRTLKNYSKWGGFNEDENYTFYGVESTLKTFYGEEDLLAYDGESKLVPTDLEGVIKSGFPGRVLDLIEAWCDHAELSKASECEKELNSLFEIHNSPWRIVNKTVILIDSEYIHNEIITKTKSFLGEADIPGALEEFTEAISCLTGGKTKDAIVYAHKSVESVMKSCMEIEKHSTFGKLLEKLIKSGIIPEYYNEFLTHFEKLALGAVKERNLPARAHGQGAEPTEVPKNLAEFAVNLAAVIDIFIIRQWIETRPKTEESIEEDEVPF